VTTRRRVRAPDDAAANQNGTVLALALVFWSETEVFDAERRSERRREAKTDEGKARRDVDLPRAEDRKNRPMSPRSRPRPPEDLSMKSQE
jgi:hypothetical protein